MGLRPRTNLDILPSLVCLQRIFEPSLLALGVPGRGRTTRSDKGRSTGSSRLMIRPGPLALPTAIAQSSTLWQPGSPERDLKD